MSGVRTGSRLQRLLRLRARIDQEIAVEARAQALRGAQPPPRVRPAPPEPIPVIVGATLDELGVSGNDVKLWALSVGLVDKVNRGPCPNSLIDEYATAHRKADK